MRVKVVTAFVDEENFIDMYIYAHIHILEGWEYGYTSLNMLFVVQVRWQWSHCKNCAVYLDLINFMIVFIFDHYLFKFYHWREDKYNFKFAEERMKLYKKSLTNKKAALTSTSLPNQDIKLSLKDLSYTEKVHQEKATRQTGTVKTHILGTFGRVQIDYLFK